MSFSKLAIIGGGNLGSSIAEGLLQTGFLQPGQLVITRRNLTPILHFEQRGVKLMTSNTEAVKWADVVILAVKPYNTKTVVHEIAPELKPQHHLLISVVTGITIDELSSWINKPVSVIRAMPNTAIAIRESMTCLSFKQATPEQITWTEQVFNQLGKSIVIDEKLMDAATILGACGIAYALRFIRASIQGGIEIGFDARTANLIAAQTVKGAAELLIRGNRHPEEEIDKVTTPKGCTIAGLNEMEHQGFSSSLIKGITVSYRKIARDE
ncbi:MAG: pyrroline-5-carboxylate reductase [Thermoflavifilum sp.]|nr:pyrroline-5-carboxylate reductase [Thermoflavifilum sp.]